MRPILLLLALGPGCADDPTRPAQSATDGADDGGDPTDGEDGSADGADGSDGSDGGHTGDTGVPITWLDIPNHCGGDGPDGVDPFTLTGSVINTEGGGSTWFTEILDLTYLPDADRVITAGQGGVAVFDVSNPADPITRGHLGAGDRGFERYYHVLPSGPDLAWATHRDVGLDALDLSDPDAPALLHRNEEQGYEGLARGGDHLYVANTRGYVDSWSVAGGSAPTWASRATGLGRPWDVAVGDGALYVADGDLGLVVLSLADPANPTLVGSVASAGMPIRLVVDEDTLYMVSGAGGLEIFDLSDPLSPTLLHQLDMGGSAQDVAVAEGLVAVTTQEAVVLTDIGRDGSPENPLPFAYQETVQYAMSVHGAGGRWAVGDWNIMGLWEAGTGPAPAIDISADTVAFLDGAETRVLRIENRGGATLDLYGVEVPDGIVAQVSALSIASGDNGLLALTWDGSTPVNDTRVCLSSDDPGNPSPKLVIRAGGAGEGRAIGQLAPDFALADLDGGTWRLSEQLGHPVVLAYFATW